MNVEEEVAKLELEFPGCTIYRVPQDNPTELVCEIGRTEMPDQSVAIAIIDESIRHYHHEAIEVYVVEKGRLEFTLQNRTYILEVGMSKIIPVDQTHSARGTATRVRVICEPAWKARDHIIKR